MRRKSQERQDVAMQDLTLIPPQTLKTLISRTLTYLGFSTAVALAIQGAAIAETVEQAASSNPNATTVLFNGFAGAILGASVALVIYLWSIRPPKCKAYDVLKGLSEHLGQPEGQYYFTDFAETNYRVAKHIYENANGAIIATAFHENPLLYGEDDLAGRISKGVKFTRISCTAVCDSQSEEKARKFLSALLESANLVVIPKDSAFTRIDGIFSMLTDGSFLAFLTFRHPSNPQENRGAVFMDGIDKTGSTTNGLARTLFIYYQGLAHQYGKS